MKTKIGERYPGIYERGTLCTASRCCYRVRGTEAFGSLFSLSLTAAMFHVFSMLKADSQDMHKVRPVLFFEDCLRGCEQRIRLRRRPATTCHVSRGYVSENDLRPRATCHAGCIA